MLPDDTGPYPVQVLWSCQTAFHHLYVTVVVKQQLPPPDNQCGGYQIRMDANLIEHWQFRSPGYTVAMIRFPYATVATFSWRDADGNLLGQLHGTNQLIQLTWELKPN